MKARTVQQAVGEFARANQDAAAVILANPERHGGESAARAVDAQQAEQSGAGAAPSDTGLIQP